MQIQYSEDFPRRKAVAEAEQAKEKVRQGILDRISKVNELLKVTEDTMQKDKLRSFISSCTDKLMK